MWMWMSVWAAPPGHVCVLTFSLPCFPVSPLSMIHRFLRPFSLHPIDGFQSYLNFKVLMRCSGGQGSALLTYRLYKVTIREVGEKKSRSIYQDVLLYFFYPSQRRWFYFSENPLNSDQVRWLLSLETQELSHHNRYKWTLKRGAWGRLMVFSEFFFLLLFKHHKIILLKWFQIENTRILLHKHSWFNYRWPDSYCAIKLFLPVCPLLHTSTQVWTIQISTIISLKAVLILVIFCATLW